MVGHYRIIEKIGSGGMGEVYSADDVSLRRKVALKFLPIHLCPDAGSRMRFTREARAAARLDHPNIVTVYEVGEFEGRPFFAMQFVDGQSVQEAIINKNLPYTCIVEISIQICEGLRAAHLNGIVHRDMKPANVIVSPGGRVKILDFGLAHLQVEPLQTQTGAIVGTVNYMSPEQVQGHGIDQRTDIFSAGVVFYEMLTGVNPFVRSTFPATIHAIAMEAHGDLVLHRSTIPDGFQSIVDRALAKNPNDRYQSCDDFLSDLKRLKTVQSSVVSNETSSILMIPASIPADQPSIAVLPFVNMSPDPENEYFADGLSEELLNVLTKIGNLRVAARTSSFVFKNSREDVRVIGHRLNVATILEGSVRKSGSRVRITVQLVKVRDGYHIWSETYDRTLDDIFVVQDEIARSVVKQLRTTLIGEKDDPPTAAKAGADVAMAVKGRGDNAEAYRLYIKGQFHVERLTREDVAAAVDCFRRALKLDPQFALAWAGLARAYADQAGHGWISCEQGFNWARAAAEKALEIEPDLAEGHMRLGLIRMSHDWDWNGSVSAVRRALELAPGRVSVLRTAAHLASNLNRLDEAITFIGRAAELDPLSSTAYHSMGIYYYSADRLTEAETALKIALELNSRQVGLWLDMARVHLAQGHKELASTEVRQEAFEPFRLLGLVMTEYAGGHTSNSDSAMAELIEKYSVDGAYQIAEACAFRGNVDQAFAWLERAYEQRDPGLPEMRVEPLLRSLHGDPRWQPFLARLGFGE